MQDFRFFGAKKVIYPLVLLTIVSTLLPSQEAEAWTLRYDSPKVNVVMRSGPDDLRIGVVFLGDGYTKSEMGRYEKDVEKAAKYLFSESDPMSTYRNSFNVYRVNVVSKQSGAKKWLLDFKDTALDCFYFGDRSLLVGNLLNFHTAANCAPRADLIIVLVNDQKYGGNGGALGAVVSRGTGLKSILLHEIGHTFGKLGDEYSTFSVFPIPIDRSLYFFEPPFPNLTINTNRNDVKWKQWIGVDGVDLFEGGNYATYGIYRPTKNGCLMRTGNMPFCKVCREDGMVKQIQVNLSKVFEDYYRKPFFGGNSSKKTLRERQKLTGSLCLECPVPELSGD